MMIMIFFVALNFYVLLIKRRITNTVRELHTYRKSQKNKLLALRANN